MNDRRLQWSWISVLAAAISAATGCASATVHSVRDPAFNGRIERLAVIVNDQNANDALLLKGAMIEHLQRTLTTYTVLAISETASGNAMNTQLQGFHPDAILTITPVAVMRSPSGARFRLSYDASLRISSLNGRRIWRAQVAHEDRYPNAGAETHMAERMKAAAQQLVQRLVSDEIVLAR